MRSPRRSNGTPAAAYSCGIQPIPSPTVSRPPETTSSDVSVFASSAGAVNGAQMVAVPSRIRSVTAATSASGTTGSSTDSCAGPRSSPTGLRTRWKVHSDAYPSASARRAIWRIVSGVAQRPETGRPNPTQGKVVRHEDGSISIRLSSPGGRR